MAVGCPARNNHFLDLGHQARGVGHVWCRWQEELSECETTEQRTGARTLFVSCAQTVRRGHLFCWREDDRL